MGRPKTPCPTSDTSGMNLELGECGMNSVSCGNGKLRQWLIDQIDSGKYPGLVWENDEKSIFRIPWKHAGKQDYNREEDAALFKVRLSLGLAGQEGCPSPSHLCHLPLQAVSAAWWLVVLAVSWCPCICGAAHPSTVLCVELNASGAAAHLFPRSFPFLMPIKLCFVPYHAAFLKPKPVGRKFMNNSCACKHTHIYCFKHCAL